MTDDRTDAFESAVQAIARKKNGDAVTTDDLWDLIIAVDKDGQTRDQLKVQMIGQINERIERGRVRLEKVEEAQLSCHSMMKTLIEQEHDKRHADHMAKFHSPEKERMTWLVDTAAVKIGGVAWFLVGGLIMALVSYLVWGNP